MGVLCREWNMQYVKIPSSRCTLSSVQFAYGKRNRAWTSKKARYSHPTKLLFQPSYRALSITTQLHNTLEESCHQDLQHIHSCLTRSFSPSFGPIPSFQRQDEGVKELKGSQNTTMASLWSKSAPDPPKDNADVADTGLADVGLPAPQPLASIPMGRPQLQRNQPQPPPPHQPPPPPSPQQANNPNDSLSLMQLRRIVTEFPKVDPISYAFTYSDAATFEEEIDEWFSYNAAEFKRLHRAKNTFERRWKKFSEKPWLEADDDQHMKFVKQEVEHLRYADLRRRCTGLQTVLHIILGVWNETAGMEKTQAGEPAGKGTEETGEFKQEADSSKTAETETKTKATQSQLDQMKAGMLLIAEAGGIPLLYRVMQNALKCLW